MYTGDSLDAGHYFSCCCASDGDGSDDGDCDWWRQDDTTAVRTMPDAALYRSRRSSETPYLLFYRLKEAGMTEGRLSSLTPTALMAAELPDCVFTRKWYKSLYCVVSV